MEVLSILSNHVIVFSILVGILIVNFIGIIYLMVKERNEDQNEINSLLKEREPISKESITEKEQIQDKQLEQNKKEVEDMLRAIERDLEDKNESAVETFENEQEEKSIISYQELLESVKKQQKVNVTPVKFEPKKNEYQEHLSINDDVVDDIIEEDIKTEEEVYSKPEKIIEDIYDKEDIYSKTEDIEEEKFKNTDFISPIFGKQANVFRYNTVPKKVTENKEENIVKRDVVDTSKLDYQKDINTDFLNALKEFRKNLD